VRGGPTRNVEAFRVRPMIEQKTRVTGLRWREGTRGILRNLMISRFSVAIIELQIQDEQRMLTNEKAGELMKVKPKGGYYSV